jgi:hypothetical protein
MRRYPRASDDGTFNWTLDATAYDLQTGRDGQELHPFPFLLAQTGDQAAAESAGFDVGQDGASFGA